MALDMRGAGDSVEGWVRFADVGMLLDEPMLGDRGYALVPYDAAGFFDSIKNWVKKAATNVAKVAKAGFAKVKSGLSYVLDSGIGKMAQNYLGNIPGIGTAAAAALGGLSSALKGNNWSTVLLDAASKALPGGPIAQTAFAAARGALEGALSGKGIKGALAGAAGKALSTGLGSLTSLLPKGISQVLGKKETAGFELPSVALSRVQRVQEARMVAQALVDRPELRGLTTRALAEVLGVSPACAQAGQAALLSFIAPDAPAFPAGASLDTAGGFLGAAAAPVVTAAVPLRRSTRQPFFPKMNPRVASMLPHIVPGLRGVDPRFVALAAGRSRPRVRLVIPKGDVQGIDGAKWRVTAGDYYAKIAAAMGQPNDTISLIRANPSIKSPYTLQVGQLLNLPETWLAGIDPAPAPTLPPWVPEVVVEPTDFPGQYTVQAGDTMQIIATKHGHPNDVAVLIAANPQIPDKNQIQPGQTINIPLGWVDLNKTPVPPPRVEIDPNNKEPSWYIPGTNPDDYQLPDGSWETFPGEAYQAKLPTEVWARVQTELAAWNKGFPGACTPADYGQPTDFTALWDNRTKQAISSYQQWAKMRGEVFLRTDGVLDDVTQDSLDRTFAKIVKAQIPNTPGTPNTPPAPIPNVPGLPQIPPLPGIPQGQQLPTPAPANKQDNGGSLMLAMLPLAAAFLS